jgi:hypothetical protein
MAPVETDSDNRMSAKKNLCIVFLLLTAENSDPEQRMAWPGPTIRFANAADRSNERTRSAGKCGQIYGGLTANGGRCGPT